MVFLRICTGVVSVLFIVCFLGCRFDGPAAIKKSSSVVPDTPRASAVPDAPAVVMPSQEPPAQRPQQVLNVTRAQAAAVTLENAVINEDTVWTGWIQIYGSVYVSPQATLTIAPGTVVAFSTDHTGDTAGALLVRGRLVVSGTADQPVTFCPASLMAEPGSWRGLVILGSEKNNRIAHATIAGAQTGIDAVGSTVDLNSVVIASSHLGARFQRSLVTVVSGEAASCGVAYSLLDSDVDIRLVRVSGAETGVQVQGGSLAMEKSSLVKNRTALLANNAVLQLERVTLSQNTAGLTCFSCEGIVAAGSVMENYEHGLSLKDSRVRVVDNDISRNTGVGVRVENGMSAAWGNIFSFNGLYDIYNAGAENFTAPGNWWRTTQLREITRRVFDRSDDPSRGIVEVSPALPGEPVFGPRDFP